MNNGKVRIYELSKELNLENKDLIDICEQLSIAVKSHSSTITESQAEQIRLAAENYQPSHNTGKMLNNAIGQATTKGTNPESKLSEPTENHKQKILAIHKQNRNSNSSESKVSKKNPTPVLAPPPRPPVSSDHKSESISLDKTLQLKPPSKSDSEDSFSFNNEILETPETPEIPETPETLDQSLEAEKRELLEPPSRPKKTASVNQEDKNLNRQGPTLKSNKKPGSQETGNKPVISIPSLKNKEAEKTTKPSANNQPAEQQKKTGTRPQRSNKIGSSQEPQKLSDGKQLQVPKPYQESRKSSTLNLESDELLDEFEEPEETFEEDIDLTEKGVPQLKLKRPNPPAAKRQQWEDEEEEGKAKAKGVASKARKRHQIIEDDDDFESDLDSTYKPLAVSLSIARPPKPPSDNVTNNNVNAVTVNKNKKPPTKGGGGSKLKYEQRREKKEAPEVPTKVTLSKNLTVRELSELINTPETDIIKQLFFKGIAVNITQTLEIDTVRMLVEELGIEVETAEKQAMATKVTEMLDVKDLENLHRRPPVVTIMGHVDHGKTTLLDSIRKTKVAQGEAGGITQHIGAYHVDVEHNGQPAQIVFLDTPGHEAFTAMRARGARVTDIAILVVAADDGVQPQTREAVSHAKAAKVPIIVAINKMDKLDSNSERIKQELAELSLVAEDWGGDTIMVPVSALKGENLDTLLEMILLVADLEELSANPHRLAKGTVIEANLDRSKGPTATLLVQNGSLHVGDLIVAGSVYGKIRAMINDRGAKVDAALPSFAVEVLGLNEVPAAGDEFEVFDNEKEARVIAESRAEAQRQSRLQQAMSSRRISLSSISEKAREGELKELNLILKADVQGSLEAILTSLQQLPQNEVQIRILLSAPGEITETDVDLAAASGAIILGFNTTLASGARSAADQEGVDIREYNIIYKLLDDIQGAMEGLLDPEEIEESLGTATVREVFPVGKGAVAGCYVLSGKVVRNRFVRVSRGNEVLYEGTLDSLKRFKEDAKEVAAGYECGIGISKFSNWQLGDSIEAYEMSLKRRTLSAN